MDEFVNIHTHHPQNNCIAIVNAAVNASWRKASCFSFGLHPWEIGKVASSTYIDMLRQLCQDQLLVAIGEIGLDRSIDTSFNVQLDVFIKQVEIAEEFELPVIVHSVKTNSDIIAVKKKLKNTTPWILHGFRGNKQEAGQMVAHGCYLSFGKALLKSQKLQEVLKTIPPDWIFFETDEDEIAIEDLYKKASEIIDVDTEQLKSKIYENYLKVFGEECTMNG